MAKDQDQERMEGSQSTKERVVGLAVVRGKCWTGTWKRALRITGFLDNQRFELNLKLLCQNAIVSETLALPSAVLLAIVAYAVVAAVFYNSDS